MLLTTSPVILGRHAELLLEHFDEILAVGVAELLGDLIDLQLGVAEACYGLLHLHIQDILADADPADLLEQPGHIRRMKRDRVRYELLAGLRQISRDTALHLLDNAHPVILCIPFELALQGIHQRFPQLISCDTDRKSVFSRSSRPTRSDNNE